MSASTKGGAGGVPKLSSEGGPGQLDQLMLELEQNLVKSRLSQAEQQDYLGRVKVLGRQVQSAGTIFTKRGIEILSRYGLDHSLPDDTSREALRCLANAFLLNEPSRQFFVDLGYAPKAAERLKDDSRDTEFLISRILFFLTYNTTLDFDVLIQQNDLAGSINRKIAWHAKNFSQSGRRKSDTSPQQDAAMCETLKLLFNITYHCPDQVIKFTPSIEPLFHVLIHHPLPTPPLQPPTSYILNALLNLDFKSAENKTPDARSSPPPFPDSNSESIVPRLVTIFDMAIKQHPERDLDEAAAPLCTLLRRTYELATPQMRFAMRRLLLPSDQDRDLPLGHSDTFASRLLRLSCSPHLPTLRDNISALLFELSDKNASKFIRNIGYGFASGFLTSQNIPIPAEEASGVDEPEADVNPITGQRWAAEDRDAHKGVEMTEEEKEREAERLFVLFERLKATGVVDVKNPVQQAIDEGRFEELDD